MDMKGLRKVKVIRKPTTAGTAVEFKFDVSGSRFLIKNLTDSTITCTILGSEIVLPANTSQMLATRMVPTMSDMTDTITVTAEETNAIGVEIQCLDY